MIKKIVLSLITVLSFCSLALAQNKQVTGTVTDEKGEPIIGATVVAEGTSAGTTTGGDGQFTLTVPANATLSISFIGYETQKVSVAGKTHIDVTLGEEATGIEDVVVIGYGTGKKIGSVIGSVDQVKSEKIENRPSTNVVDALQGQVAGLQIMTGNGELTSTSSIRIHGLGSMGADTSPLILLDGAPIQASTLQTINQNDIASVNVLKDASATAPYGIRGANGVIIVTTKRGRKGEKPTVDFKASVGVSEPIRYPDYLGSAGYATLYNEAMLNDNPSLDPGSASLFSQETISNFRRAKGDNSDGLGYNWDYFDYAFKPSILQDYSLSVRGGTDRARYFILGSYYNQGGNYKHSNSDNVNKFLRYNFRANVDVDATKRLKISVDLGARVTEYNYPGATAANIISLANTQPPTCRSSCPTTTTTSTRPISRRTAATCSMPTTTTATTCSGSSTAPASANVRAATCRDRSN